MGRVRGAVTFGSTFSPTTLLGRRLHGTPEKAGLGRCQRGREMSDVIEASADGGFDIPTIPVAAPPSQLTNHPPTEVSGSRAI